MKSFILLIVGLVFLVSIYGLETDLEVETFSGRVVHVSDGDTLTLDIAAQTLRVRLIGIDAPELNQPYGIEAKNILHSLTQGQAVELEDYGQDRYGRTLGLIFINGVNINSKMVENGAAWVYRKYTSEQALFAYETAAREARLGLWNFPDSVPPWEWRRRFFQKDQELN